MSLFRMTGVSTRISSVLLCVSLYIGCASGSKQTQSSSEAGQSPTTQQQATAPPPAPLIKASFNLPQEPSKDPALIRQGKRLFQQNCIACHQRDAIGKPGKAPSLTNDELLAISTIDFYAYTIAEGRPGTGMQPLLHIGEDNIYAIVSYLFSFAEQPSRAGEINAQPAANGDVKVGKKLYDDICQSCHGPDGNGYDAGGTGTAIGKIGFLSKVSDGFIRTTIKEGRSNTRMKGFQGPEALADLSDAEIDDIISYLRTVPSK